jgi:8-oxo-dGTP diphosphatase
MNKKYDSGRVAVNAVIFSVRNKELVVYLTNREKEPFSKFPELPGGLLLPNETAEETLSRKINDLVSKKDIFFRQFYTFTSPDRDPRGRVISISFMALVPFDSVKDIENFHAIKNIRELAFDHEQIIKKAHDFLKNNLDGELVKHFIPSVFPLNQLQEIYEAVKEVHYDNRNFRKKILNSELIVKAKVSQKNVPHRPASLYRFK